MGDWWVSRVCRAGCEHQYQVPLPPTRSRPALARGAEAGAWELWQAGQLVHILGSPRQGLGGLGRGEIGGRFGAVATFLLLWKYVNTPATSTIFPAWVCSPSAGWGQMGRTLKAPPPSLPTASCRHFPGHRSGWWMFSYLKSVSSGSKNAA